MTQGKDHAILTLPAFPWRKGNETGPAFLVAELGGKRIEVFFFYKLNEDERGGGKDPTCTYFCGPHGKVERLLVSADSVEDWTRQYCLFEVENGSFECWQIKTHDRQSWMWPLWTQVLFQTQDGTMRVQSFSDEDWESEGGVHEGRFRPVFWAGKMPGRQFPIGLLVFNFLNWEWQKGNADWTYLTGPTGEKGFFRGPNLQRQWLGHYCLFEAQDGTLSCYRISAYDQASGLITWEPVSLEVLDEKES